MLWVWHVPSWYEAALRSDAIHAAQHLSLVLVASLFWWAMVHGRYGRIGYGAAVCYVFLTAIHSSALGALLTVSPVCSGIRNMAVRRRSGNWTASPISSSPAS